MATSGAAGGRITAGAGTNLIGQHSHDRNQEATVYMGNIDSQVRTAQAPPGARGGLSMCIARHAEHEVPPPAFLQVTEEMVWELCTQAGPVGELGCIALQGLCAGGMVRLRALAWFQGTSAA